jgi:hypothetical protein
MIFGKPQLRIARMDIDLVGIMHLETAKLWQPNASGLDPLAVLAQRPMAPSFTNTLQIAESTIRKGGAMETHWTHEGASNDPSQPLKTYGVSIDYGADPAFQERSLLLHPDWSTIQADYGATIDADNNINWPPSIASNQTPGLGAASDSNNQTPNPMYGYQTYFSMATTAWTYRWADTQVRASFSQDIGKIVDASQIPGTPSTPQGRNWIKLPVKFRRRGFVFEFVGTWWMSGEDPWPTPVYDPQGATSS